MNEQPLINLTKYVQAMQKSIDDKLFFLDQIPKNQSYMFVDFGCADGTLLKEIQKRGDHKLIGYDKSPEMLSKARFSSKGITYTNDWYSVCMALKSAKELKILILSSVIHEVYSYAKSQQDIIVFWARVLNSGFDYICIRDMCPKRSIKRLSNQSDEIKVLRNTSFEQLKSFEENFGKVQENKNLIHFLLKYRYIVNWTREVNENYFPLYEDELISLCKPYTLVYYKGFILDFIKECVKKDYDIIIKDQTHVKMIFKLS